MTEPKEPIRDHGKIVTAPAGTSESEVAAKLTGSDQVPSLEELGRAKAPPFDPSVGREVEPGREHGDKPETMISTMVLMGVDRGGDFEDAIQQVVRVAERLGLTYVHASIAAFDLDQHADSLLHIADEIKPEADGNDEPEEEDEWAHENPERFG